MEGSSTDGTIYVAVGRGYSRGRGRGFRPLLPSETVQVKDQPLVGDDKKDVSLLAEKFSSDLDLSCSSTTEEDSKKTVLLDKSICESTSENSANEPFQPKKSIKVGTLGEKCRCLTNFVELRQTTPVPVFEYLVNFKPAVSSMKLKKRMIKQLESVLGPVKNFDGHILYLPHKLNETVTIIRCLNPLTDEEVEAHIKFLKEKEFRELCHFYNILFQSILTELGFLEIRNGYYEVSELRHLPNHKLEIWPGISLNVEIKDEGVVVMIDTPSRVLRGDTAYNYYKAMKEDDPENYKKKFENFIVGKIIRCSCTEKCYKIDDVAWDLNPTSDFPYKHGLIAFKDYFKMQYGVMIKDLEQPMIISRTKPKQSYPSNVTEPVDNIRFCAAALAPETCNLTGLTSDHRESSKIMGEISTIIRQNPTARVRTMRTIVERILSSEYAKKLFKEWGITLHSDLIEVVGRKLPPPTISFHKGTEGRPAQYKFRKECRSCYEAVEIHSFLVLCTNNDRQRAHSFIQEYAIACSSLGIRLRSRGDLAIVEGNNPSDFVKVLEKSCNPDKVQFVVIILPSFKEDVYRAVKKFCLTVVPIPSQCILSRSLFHRNIHKVVHGVCMQVNCKLGGSLWGLNIPFKKIMFMGMDAAHDPTRKNPSIIALVASLNDTATSYFSRCFPLPIHQEVNTCMRTMFMDALMCYKQRNGHSPDHIIFFRDGGSSANFDVLKKYEIEECLQVLKEDSLESHHKTEFTYLCVAKRIPQRLFLCEENGDITNPSIGTVVDSAITKPNLYDFYVISQLVSQGATSPTHYTVLHETKRTKPDVLQKLAYAATFMYYNWPGCIKVPHVIQYSHKLGQIVSRMKEIPSRAMEDKLYYL